MLLNQNPAELDFFFLLFYFQERLFYRPSALLFHELVQHDQPQRRTPVIGEGGQTDTLALLTRFHDGLGSFGRQSGKRQKDSMLVMLQESRTFGKTGPKDKELSRQGPKLLRWSC